MSIRTPDILAAGGPMAGRPQPAANHADGRLPDRLARTSGGATEVGQVPLGLRIALAIGLEPHSRQGGRAFRRGKIPDLDLVGGVARTLARRRTRNQPP